MTGAPGPTAGGLGGLPGSDVEPGIGPVVPACFEALLDDAAALHGVDVVRALVEHRAHRASWYADLLGALVVPATRVGVLLAAVTSADLGLPVVLVADTDDPRNGLAHLREARTALVDDDRLLLTGVRLALPAGGDLGSTTRALLSMLDFSVPAWVQIPLTAGWERALEVIAADGAEDVALDVAATAQPAAPDQAAFLRRTVDLDLTTRLIGSTGTIAIAGTATGLLNAVCAVRAALNGAGTTEIAAVLAATRTAPITSALRRMSDADAALTRAFLGGVETGSVADAVEGLAALGLVDRG